MTTDPLGTWKARIERAQSEAQGLKGIFKTTLQDRAPANATFFEHDGQEVSIVGLVIERSSGSELFDEEALPFFKGGFADGAELLLFAEEILTDQPALRALINAVCSGFAVAREMGYVGPYNLVKEGTAEELQMFDQAVKDFLVEHCTPAPLPQEARDAWTSSPVVCPYCGDGSALRELEEWSSQSLQESDNQCTLTEYQCHAACEGRSFWC